MGNILSGHEKGNTLSVRSWEIATPLLSENISRTINSPRIYPLRVGACTEPEIVLINQYNSSAGNIERSR